MKHSNEYYLIRAQANQWPDWKKKTYNCNFAISAHAHKLPIEEDRA